MAAQRRAGPGGGERRRPAGGKARAGGTAPGRGWTLRGAAPGAALLGSAVLVGGLLGWSLPGGLQGGAEVLARGSEAVRDRFVEVACSGDYGAGRRFEGCTPRKCGRGVTDAVITREEAERIRRIAERGLSFGGSDGGINFVELSTGEQ